MSEKTIKSILITFTSICMFFFCILPFIWMCVISFSKNPDFLSRSPAKFIFTLTNYYEIISIKSLHFIDYLKNSLIVCSLSTIIVIVIASLAAYAFSRINFPGRLIIPVMVLAFSMFPQISIVGFLFRFMTKIGIINTYPALIFPYIAWTLPFALWILLSYFIQLPHELDESGMVDGATRIQILLRIIFPVAAPGIFACAILIFISCFNEFLFAFMLTSDFRARTIPIGIVLFQGLHGEIPWGQIMAISAVSAVPLIVMTLIFQKRIISGLTAGAVKG
ncbi:MAG: carbohydrate ABC transporter permease [Elusimicrobia bacterium]|nr:carbohydrate ABC transporter permease [Elusimicrobiota bacterium]